MISNLNKQFFIDNGFLVLNELLGDINDVSTLLETTLKTVKIPTSKNDAKEWISAKGKLQSNKILTDLIKRPQITKVLENLLGEFKEPKSCQIASRFPRENYDDVKKWNPIKEWHIDNYTDKDFERKRIPQDFSCLVGVYLTDNISEFSGNFTVFPGSHHQIQSHSIMNGGKKHYEENGLDKIREELVLGKPFQIVAKKGTVIFAHRHLAHLISAPNKTENIRTIIWFRVRGKYNSDLSFTNIWNDFKGISKDTKYPEKHKESIIKLENKGYGYFCSNTKNGIVLRIKSNGNGYFPCMFASHITLNYYENGNTSTSGGAICAHKGSGNTFTSGGAICAPKGSGNTSENPSYSLGSHQCNISVHTNGFINRNKHNLIIKELQGKTLFEMSEWIYNCDYCKLIESWYQSPSQNILNSGDDKIIQKIIKLHHLHSKSKSNMLIKWGNELRLNGGILKGAPGMIIAIGPSTMINIFFERFKCFHWKQYKEIDETYNKIFTGFILIDSMSSIN